jgi:hypothetical protein
VLSSGNHDFGGLKELMRNPTIAVALFLAFAWVLSACTSATPPASPANTDISSIYLSPTPRPSSAGTQTNSISFGDVDLRNALTEYLKVQTSSPPNHIILDPIPNRELSDAIVKWLNQQSDSSGLKNVWPVALGIVLGGLFNFFAIAFTSYKQRQRELELDAIKGQRERELERLRATLEQHRQSLSILTQRFDKFDAPLWALFQQSRGVTDGLMQYIHQQSTNKMAPWTAVNLRLTTSQDRQQLEVKHHESWFKFRMLDYMDLLNADTYSKELVEAILDIGKEKCRIIREHAGYASASGEFSKKLGEYLAHYAILQTISKQSEPKRYPPESQKVGYYPRGLDDEIKNGFISTNTEIQTCQQACSTTIQEIAKLTTP